MGQFGFFDADKRLAVISAKGDSPEMINRVVPFESFRAEIEGTRPTKTILSDAGYFAKRVTLSLALRSSGDAGRGFRRDRAAATLVA